MKLRTHQARFIERNPDKALLNWTPRAGKSLAAKLWVEHPRRNSAQVVVCKKSNKKEWEEYCPHARVLTKEEFKKVANSIVSCSAIVVDEAHNFAAPLFIPKERSALAESLYEFIRKHDPHVLLLTGTPLTNKPASLHTLMVYIGKYMEWKKFRERYYSLESRPFLPRPAWMPLKKWRHRANEKLLLHSDTVTLHDCAPYLPPVIEEILTVKPGVYEYEEDENESWSKDHRAEQYNKGGAIRDLPYRKLIVVCKYTEQIDALKKELGKDKPVYVLDGRTKDQAGTVSAAQEEPDCYLIVQAACGEGWDGWQFDAMVFASMSHRVIDHAQMHSRLVSLDHVKPRIYYYLLAEGASWDRKIYTYVVKENRDFTQPSKEA